MKEMLDAARMGDFAAAKNIFDEAVSQGKSSKELIHAVDRRQRSVAHYAAEYDELIVIEWLYSMGADLYHRDDSNKSPIEITVLLDAKLKRKKKEGSEVLPLLKSRVLNPIQQIFYLDFGESSKSVTGPSDLSPLELNSLQERFPYHNNLQAHHLFAIDGRVEELRYLKSRGVDMKAADDDGNTALHLCNSAPAASFLIEECGLDVNLQNTSDGYTPAHSVIERVAMDDLDESVALSILQLLIDADADFSVRCDEGSDVVEFALDMVGKGSIATMCMSARGAPGQDYVDQFVTKTGAADDSASDISVASHDNKVIAEDGEDSDESDAEDEECDDEDISDSEGDSPTNESVEEFFVKRK